MHGLGGHGEEGKFRHFSYSEEEEEEEKNVEGRGDIFPY